MTKQLTLDEVYEKYGDVHLQFSSYYKYTFTFISQLKDGKVLLVWIGGDSDDIYRFDVCAGNNGSLNVIKNCYSLKPKGLTIYADGSRVEELEYYND